MHIPQKALVQSFLLPHVKRDDGGGRKRRRSRRGPTTAGEKGDEGRLSEGGERREGGGRGGGIEGERCRVWRQCRGEGKQQRGPSRPASKGRGGPPGGRGRGPPPCLPRTFSTIAFTLRGRGGRVVWEKRGA